LKPGATFAQAQAALDVLAPAIKRANAAFYDGELRYTVTPLLDDITRSSKAALTAAVAAVLLLLVIAFANAAALVVARLKNHETDLAIRTAIGATPRALVAEALAESTLLAVGGAVVGSLLAIGTIAGVQAAIPRTVPRWDQIGVGWGVVGYAAALSFVGLIVSCLVPLWRVSRRGSWQAIRSGSAQGGKAEGTTARLVLVGGQIAFTVVLGFGCAQLLRSAAHLRRVDLGYEPNVLIFKKQNKKMPTALAIGKQDCLPMATWRQPSANPPSARRRAG
jgi:hypothetical protein